MKRLAPRTTGRRFRRQRDYPIAAAGVEKPGTAAAAMADPDPDCDAPTVSEESAAAAAGAARRHPPADVESRIDAAIAARRAHRNDALGAEDRPGEEEVLGDYEYLDHTADIQLHSWGGSFEDALRMQVLAMFGYMTKLSLVGIDDEASRDHATDEEVAGHDAQSLVFAFLQEWLTLFHETGFLVKEIYDLRFDRGQWKIQCSGRGELFDSMKHTQGTEVKAVTYSNLTVVESDDRCDIWVIVDI